MSEWRHNEVNATWRHRIDVNATYFDLMYPLCKRPSRTFHRMHLLAPSLFEEKRVESLFWRKDIYLLENFRGMCLPSWHCIRIHSIGFVGEICIKVFSSWVYQVTSMGLSLCDVQLLLSTTFFCRSKFRGLMKIINWCRFILAFRIYRGHVS